MAKRWAFKECKALNAIVEAKADSLYTKKGQPRKTVPEAFWEAVSMDMEQAGFKNRSASSVRKKFSALGWTIQGSLNYPKPEPVDAKEDPSMANERKTTDLFAVEVGEVLLNVGDVYVSEGDLFDFIEKRGDAGTVVYYQGKMVNADGETTKLFRIPRLASPEQYKTAANPERRGLTSGPMP